MLKSEIFHVDFNSILTWSNIKFVTADTNWFRITKHHVFKVKQRRVAYFLLMDQYESRARAPLEWVHQVQLHLFFSTLFATLILNDRKMRPLYSALQNIKSNCRNQREEQKLNFHDGLLSFQLTTAGQSAELISLKLKRPSWKLIFKINFGFQ